MKEHFDGTLPKSNDVVFVFGSNIAGIHGAGAAKMALRYYGAIRGQGEGRNGRSYAIPTKSRSITTLPLNNIRTFVNEFVKYTVEHPDEEFFITRIGCGLAGYKDVQIAPMFKGIGDNCSVPKQWVQYLT